MAIGVTLVYPAYKTDNNHPPLGLLYLSAVLRKNNIPVKILDTTFIKDEQELEREILENKNKIFGLSVVTPYINKAVFISRKIRKLLPDTVIIFGGPHPTIRPLETLDEPTVDIIVLGEAEETIIELVNAIENKKSLSKIKGIGFKKGKKKIITKRREQIKNLDSIPIPDRSLLPTFSKYCEVVGGDFFTSPPATTIITSRGCPFNCNFCQPSLREIFGPVTRFRSAKNIVDEIEYLNKEFGLRKFHFVDDTFTAKRDRIFEFCNLVKKKNLKIQWTTNSRVNTVDEDMLAAMKKSGCTRLSFGVESGSQDVLDKMNKCITVEQIKNAFQMSTKLKIFSVGSLMLGYPGETRDDLAKTKNLIKTIEPDRIDLHIVNPIIGTQLHGYAKENNLLIEDNYEKYTRHGHHYLLKLEIPKNELMQFENSMYKMFRGMKRSYFFKPRKWYSAKTELRILWWHFRESPLGFLKRLPRLFAG